MIKLGTTKQVDFVKHLPTEVVHEVTKITNILDREYGANRDLEASLGGYIVIIESPAELQKLKANYLDVDYDIPEYVDLICTAQGEWLNALFILSTDFTISLFMPRSMAPHSITQYL